MICIAAVDKHWGIGRDNDLLFSVPEDMRFFRQTTSGKTVIAGRKTLLSFPGGKPLKNRVNVVLSSDAEFDGAVNVHSLSELAEAVIKLPGDDVFVIGGEMLYRTLLPYCSKALITKIDADGNADKFFPDLDAADGWKPESMGDKLAFEKGFFRFTTYVNTKVKSLRELIK